jgi:phosphoglycolate phosphatase
MSIALVIFDLDGTLIDSSVDITNALNHALSPYAVQPLTAEETIRMVGEGIPRLIEKVVGPKGNGVLLKAVNQFPEDPRKLQEIRADVKNRFIEYYSGHILDHTKEYPGVRETLEQLGSYRKAVISNKMESLSRKVLDGLGLSRYFDCVVGSDSTPEKKPSPLPVQKVLSDLHMKPDQAVMVGDSNFDVDAGKAAGVLTVAVTYGYRPRAVIAHADYLIDRMIDLVPLLKKREERG